MILDVRAHVGGRGDAVRHVEEADDGRNVPDVARAETGAAQALAVAFFDGPRLRRQFDREVEHGALTLAQARGAVVHHDLLAEQRLAGILPHGGAVRGQTVVAAVVRRHRDGDHLALELGEAARAQHQVVVHGGEGFQLHGVEGVGHQHVRDEAELVLAFLEIGGHRRRQLGRPEIERDRRCVVGRVSHRRSGFAACSRAAERRRSCRALAALDRLQRGLALIAFLVACLVASFARSVRLRHVGAPLFRFPGASLHGSRPPRYDRAITLSSSLSGAWVPAEGCVTVAVARPSPNGA